MDLSSLLGAIEESGDANNTSAPDLLKDIEQFTKDQQDRSAESAGSADTTPAFSTLTRAPMRGVEAPAVDEAQPAASTLPVESEITEPVSKTETIQYANGTRYIGELRDGKPHGKGCIYYSNGSHYEGSFEQGEKSGAGVHEWTNMVRYEGPWRAGKKEGEGVLIFPDGSRLNGTFRDDECMQGQLWKDGVLRHSGASDTVFQYVPSNSSYYSLHISFNAPLEEDSLRLVYQRLRLLQKTGNKSSFYFFIKSLFAKLASINDKKAASLIQTFLTENWQSTKQSVRYIADLSISYSKKGMAYRVLRAGEDLSYGLSAPMPLAEASVNAPLEALQQSSQFQVLTNSITWVLYNVARTYFEQRAVPRVVLVNLSATVGSAMRAKTDGDEIALLEGFVPANAVLYTFSFTNVTPLLLRLLAVRGILATPINFGAYVDWVSAVEKALRPAEMRELMLQVLRQ